MARFVNFRFAAFCAVGALAGVFFGRLLTASVLACILTPLALVAGGVLLLVWKKKWFPLVLVVCVSVGIAAATIDFFTTETRTFVGETTVKGRVVTEESAGYVLDDVTADGEEIRGKLYVKTKEAAEIGDRIKFSGIVKTYRDDPFSTFNALRYADGIYYYCTKPNIAYVADGKKTALERFRSRVGKTMEENLGSEDVGILKSLLFGDKSDLEKGDKQAVSRSGLSHVFAVSGLHVGFFAGLILWVCRKARAPRFLGAAITALVVVTYGALTGFPAGVKRVGIALAVGFGAKCLGRKADPITTLAVAAALCAVTAPREVFDVGYVMSFGAALGLVCFYRPMMTTLTKRIRNKRAKKILSYPTGLVTGTIAANAFLLPVTAATFHTFAPYAVVANLLVLPIVGALFPYAALTACLCAIWSGFGVLLKVAAYGIYAIRFLTETLASLPGAAASFGGMSVFCGITYYLTLFFVSPFVLVDPHEKLRYGAFGAASVFAMLFLA